jgi:hypothetical protein
VEMEAGMAETNVEMEVGVPETNAEMETGMNAEMRRNGKRRNWE